MDSTKFYIFQRNRYVLSCEMHYELKGGICAGFLKVLGQATKKPPLLIVFRFRAWKIGTGRLWEYAIAADAKDLYIPSVEQRRSTKWGKATFKRNWSLCFSVSCVETLSIRIGCSNFVQKSLFIHFNLISEFISRKNISDDEEADTMQFTLWRKYIFQPDLSNGLTGNEEVTTLHPGKKNLEK